MCLVSVVADAPAAHAEDPGWFTRALPLEHAAFGDQPVPAAVVHGKRGVDPQGRLSVVVFLHGFRGCAVAQMASEAVACGPDYARVPGRHLAREHVRAAGNSLLVIPQLKLMRRDGAPGRLAKAGGFAAFMRELLDEHLRTELGPGALSRVERIALVAHSAGYQAALAILNRGDLADRITTVVLLDALYAGTPGFAAWVRGDPARRLLTLHGHSGKPARNSRTLLRQLSRTGTATEQLPAALVMRPASADGSPGPAWPSFQAAQIPVGTPHAQLPAAHLAAILRWFESQPDTSAKNTRPGTRLPLPEDRARGSSVEFDRH